TRPEDDVGPSRIEVRLDLGLERPQGAVSRARVAGNLTIPLGEPGFAGDLQVGAERVELTHELLAALPPGLAEVEAQLRPEGALVDVAGRVQALDRLRFSAAGDGLYLKPGPGPREGRRFLVGVDRVRVSRDASNVHLEELTGRAPGGGTL